MNILITGVTSFIGRATAKELMRRGFDVYGVVRKDSKRRDALKELDGLNIVECNMDECEALADMGLPAMYACLHFAWEGSGREMRQNQVINRKNVENTVRMVATAARLGCERFIFSGSQAEYGVTLERVASGEQSAEPENENRPLAPISEYAKAKCDVMREAGRICASLNMKYIHLRIFSVYGSGDHETTLVSSCLRAVRENSEIKLSPCTQMWNMLYVDECAEICADMVDCVLTEADETEKNVITVNVASEDTDWLRSFVNRLGAAAGGGSFIFEERPVHQEGTPYLNPDIAKLKRLTGYKQRITFEDGIRRMLSDE